MPGKLSCLIIEDNLFDQKMISRAVRCTRIDTEFTFVATLGAAQSALARKNFTIILCDNSLPDGNGTEFVRGLAHDPEYRNTTIVIVSGWPSPFMWAKARAAGIQVIDKNDQPQIKLMEVFSRNFGRYPKHDATAFAEQRIRHAR